ncbi:MAG: transglutaminase family protein [Anaerolineaceae bacterium]|nr:transglutaminase family protein [Anaerolineaceae bacterium]
MIYYAVTHLTVYKYSEPITDSVMEIRKQPRTEKNQRNLRFNLEVSPSAKVTHYTDYLGNVIHHFDIPAPHEQLAVKSEAIVEVKPLAELPEKVEWDVWDALDAIADDYTYFDMLTPGPYTHSSALLDRFAQEINLGRHSDPLTVLRDLNTTIATSFEYQQSVTRVDSPIDIALDLRRGVCQDFTHIMLTLVRRLGIPARYVSGYLFHRTDTYDRSDEDASHAWLEAWLPGLGWVGFDPTNNMLVTDRHIRVCIANDYANASPSRGVFRGFAETELSVQVDVRKLDEIPLDDVPTQSEIVMPSYGYYQQQQQQQ